MCVISQAEKSDAEEKSHAEKTKNEGQLRRLYIKGKKTLKVPGKNRAM